MRFLQKEMMMIKFKKEYINKALEAIHFDTLTEVQKQVIPLLENNRDVLVESNTGSGKTHAFLLPIFDSLDSKKHDIHAVILAPTRELAKQIYKFASEIASYSEEDILIDLYTGGMDKQDIIKRLEKRMPHIVIGTPGRVIDLAVTENVLKVYTAKFFIIDEADMTLDKNFIEDLSQLLNIMGQTAVKGVFSATIPDLIKPFMRQYLDNPEIINVNPHQISSLNISHFFIKTREQNRFNTMKKLLKTINPYLAIIFCNTKESSETVYAWMKEQKKSVTLIHGGIDYRKRIQLMKRINKLEFQYIVATDIISRGIDIIGISHIINYELPRDIEFYIHRTGRTGRLNFDGIALSLYEFDDNSYLDKLEKKGIKSRYKDVIRDELVDAVIRNKRSKRMRTDGVLDVAAKKIVRKPTKVKPAYKKKNKRRLEEVKRKLARKRK